MKLGLVMFGLMVLLVGSTANVRAQMGMMGDEGVNGMVDSHEGLEVVIGELMDKYEVKTVSDLDCELVSDEDMVRLGDAVMEQMHPGERHEEMDRMMGGEESEGWWNIHLQMGRNYLGCDDDDPAVAWGGAIGGMVGRMWPMVFDWDRWDGEAVMSDKALSWIGRFMPWIGLIVFLVIMVKLLLLVLVITLLIMAIRYLWRSGDIEGERVRGSSRKK